MMKNKGVFIMIVLLSIVIFTFRISWIKRKLFDEVDIYAKVDGYVQQINVDRGDVVKKGQVLAVLDAPEMKAQLAEANAKMNAAKAKLESSRGTYGRLQKASQTTGVVAGNDLQIAQSSFMADSANYISAISGRRAYADLYNFLIIKAPFDGMITDRNVSPGELTGPGSSVDVPLFKLEDNQTLRLTVAVPEAQVANINHIDSITFTVKAYPRKVFKAKLARRAKSIDTQTRTEIVEFDVNNRDGLLQPGMYAQVSVNMQRPTVSFFVEPSAIVTNTERSFVIKVEDKQAKWVDVEKGMYADGKVEVFGNLQNNDVLILRANEEIREGDTVKATKYAASLDH